MMAMQSADIQMNDLCIYIERELEMEEIYLSARGDRYARRCEDKEMREEAERLENEW